MQAVLKDARMHARATRSSPKQLPLLRYTEAFGGTITYSPCIYTSHPYDQRFLIASNVVSIPADNPRYKEI